MHTAFGAASWPVDGTLQVDGGEGRQAALHLRLKDIPGATPTMIELSGYSRERPRGRAAEKCDELAPLSR
jgi:hypothetical protein